MEGNFHTFHVILDVDYHLVTLTNLYTRSWYHSVGGQDTTFHAVGENALTLAPDDVRCVRSAYLASPGNVKSVLDSLISRRGEDLFYSRRRVKILYSRAKYGIVFEGKVVVAYPRWLVLAAGTSALVRRGERRISA